MTLWPKSLWGQTVASTALILAFAQLLSVVLFSMLILRPELNRVADVMARNVVAMSDTLNEVTPAERKVILAHLSATHAVEIWPGAQPPDDTGPPPRMVERVFMRALVKALGDRTDLFWRTDHSRKLWLHVNLGPDPYWISVRSPPVMGPTGMVFAAALVAFLLALIAAANLNAKVLRPLTDLRAATEGYGQSAPSAPLREDGPREIAELSHSFNLMTARLAKADADRSLILAGISHDVRTPLAKLKLAFEMMSRDDAELAASAQRQIDHIDRILSQFIMFARGFEAEPVTRTDLSELISAIAADYGDRGVTFTPAATAVMVPARPEALRRAVTNLVENALNHGRPPVVVDIEPAEGFWRILVRDHGPGVAAELLATITQPFVRGDTARGPSSGGTGLGLAIAERVAWLHGGTLNLRPLPNGFEAALTLTE